jgi:hypothetical protein
MAVQNDVMALAWPRLRLERDALRAHRRDLRLRLLRPARLEISEPFLESLNGKCQHFSGEWSRKLQTHCRSGEVEYVTL